MKPVAAIAALTLRRARWRATQLPCRGVARSPPSNCNSPRCTLSPPSAPSFRELPRPCRSPGGREPGATTRRRRATRARTCLRHSCAALGHVRAVSASVA